MPLAMQGDKLLPGHQNIVRGGIRTRAPDRMGGDRGFDALENLAEVAASEFRPQRFRLQTRGVVGRMSGDVDQGGLELFGAGMAELERRQFLKMVVQQPRVVQRRLQDQRLAQRHRGAVPTMHRARRQLLADDDIGRIAAGLRPGEGAALARWPVPART